MAKNLEKTHDKRIVIMILLVVVCMMFATLRVFGYQVVDGKDYLDQAKKNSESAIPIIASRGEIVDRNGIPFTQNKAVFNVEFDYSFMSKLTQNETIYKLIKLFEKEKEEWIDELPITKTMPYEFLEGKEKEISNLKNNLNLNQYTSAQDCMDNMYELFAIKKYEGDDGRCTHCKKLGIKQAFDECDYAGYSEEESRLIAGVRYQMLMKKFSAWTTRYTFAQDIAPTTVALIREFSNELSGVEVVERAIRTYLSGEVASNLIGSLGQIFPEEVSYYEGLGYKRDEIVGKSGIEKAMETELKGTNGEMIVVKNAKGEIVDYTEKKAPVAGNTVVLTIDIKFQEKVQQLFAEYLKDFNETNKQKKHAEAGSIVVMDVKTGGVLACVSYPYFNINDYAANYTELSAREDKPLFNRALYGSYRPGSTFKPIVAAAGLTEKTITPQTTVFCDGKYHFYGAGFEPSCLQIGHRNVSLNVVSALQHSCNVFFYDTGRVLGIDRMNQYSKYFGLGTETGLELNDSQGNLSGPEYSEKYGVRWEQGNVVQAAIGQMDTSVTPLQMAIEATTLANRGTRYNAHLVKSILSNDMSKVIDDKKPVVASQFAMSDETYETITKGMVLAGKSVGAPNQLTDLGYDVAVKTGTPQVSTTKTNNAFIAYAPTENPEVAISCIVEDGYNTNQLIRRILLAYEESKKTQK